MRVLALSYPERHRLNAARGWLELNQPDEAMAELAPLLETYPRHPEIHELLWQAHAAQRQWQACVQAAQIVTEVAPELASGHIHLAYALHELGRTREAFDRLIQVVELFPTEPTLPYNLACYASRMAHFEEARAWLRHALGMPDNENLRQVAASDPDLAAYWEWLKTQPGESPA
jgi:Flp pilus assembly protein TadD